MLANFCDVFNSTHTCRSSLFLPPHVRSSQLFTADTLAGDCAGRVVAVACGDIAVFDLTRPMSSEVQPGSPLTIMLPHQRLEMAVEKRNLHGAMLLAREPVTRLVTGLLVGLPAVAPAMTGPGCPCCRGSLAGLARRGAATEPGYPIRRILAGARAATTGAGVHRCQSGRPGARCSSWITSAFRARHDMTPSEAAKEPCSESLIRGGLSGLNTHFARFQSALPDPTQR